MKASWQSGATVSMSPASAPAPGLRCATIGRKYTVGGRHFDALIFGYWEGDRLMYAARTRSGFTPTVREQLAQRFRGLERPECPFANLPEAQPGDGLATYVNRLPRYLCVNSLMNCAP